MNRIQKVLSSAAVVSFFIIVPFAASADTLSATGSTGVVINPSGIVRVIGASVTSVSDGVFNAVTTFGNTVMSWIVNVSAATNVSGNGSSAGTTTGITVGDKVSFTGSLASSTGNLLTVAATKIRDITTLPPHPVDAGATSTPNIGKHDGDNDGYNTNVGVNANANTNASVRADGNGKSEDSKGTHAGLNLLGGLHVGQDD